MVPGLVQWLDSVDIKVKPKTIKFRISISFKIEIQCCNTGDCTVKLFIGSNVLKLFTAVMYKFLLIS
jgi:hypothetical protein